MKINKGWFYIVPIYYSKQTQILSGRGFVSNVFLDIMLEIHHLFMFFTSQFMDIELGYPIKLTGETENTNPK